MMRNLKYLLKSWVNNLAKTGAGKTGSGNTDKQQPLSTKLSANLDTIRQKLGNSMDLTTREFKVGGGPGSHGLH